MTPSSTDPATPGTWWRCRAVGPGGVPVWFAVVASGLHPDGEVVDLPVDEAVAAVGEDAECVAHLEPGGRVTRLQGGRRFGETASRMWFAEVPRPRADPPGAALVAFLDHDVEPGTLVTAQQFAASGATGADQVAAVRWIPQTGQAHEIYVQPGWRRQGLGTALGAACATLQSARGGPRLWGDGSRTAEGERWRDGADWAHRAEDLTYLEAPMTPFDQR